MVRRTVLDQLNRRYQVAEKGMAEVSLYVFEEKYPVWEQTN